MKKYALYLTLIITLSFCSSQNINTTGTHTKTKPPYRPAVQSKRIAQEPLYPSDKQTLTLFSRIITRQMEPLLYRGGTQGSPAIVVGLVSKLGDLVEGFGCTELNCNRQPDGNTLFGIGSVTKVFTGLILAKAVTNGDVNLSDVANKWLDDSIKIEKEITLQQLVTHFSGLPNFPGNITNRGNSEKLMPARDYSLTELEQCLNNNQCEPTYPPGSKYQYSNLGIGILSLALQNRYGYKDFDRMNRAFITDELNMSSTATNKSDFLKKHKANLAQGYVAGKGGLESVSFSDMGILAGSGELISSANDMNKLLKALTGLLPGQMTPALEESERKLADTGKGLTISYAQEIKRVPDGGEIHFKTGITAGYTAIMFWRDNPEVGMIFLSNRGKFRQLMPTGVRLFNMITERIKMRMK